MRRAFFSTLLIGTIAAVTAGCSDPCDDALEACKACGNDADDCARSVNNCKIAPGPVGENSCCDSLVDSWDHCS